jgi:hypothetical protein
MIRRRACQSVKLHHQSYWYFPSDNHSNNGGSVSTRLTRLIRCSLAGLVACVLPFMSVQAQTVAPVAANPPPTPVASDLTRNCSASGGCVLTCMNQQGQSILTEPATRAVRIISLSNGNSEFRMDNGNAGVNVVLVSKDNLVCRLTGGT